MKFLTYESSSMFEVEQWLNKVTANKEGVQVHFSTSAIGYKTYYSVIVSYRRMDHESLFTESN